MIDTYNGSPDPLTAARLAELIAECDRNIERLTARGLHQYVDAHRAAKRRYEKRLGKLMNLVPVVGMQQVTDKRWNEKVKEANL